MFLWYYPSHGDPSYTKCNNSRNPSPTTPHGFVRTGGTRLIVTISTGRPFSRQNYLGEAQIFPTRAAAAKLPQIQEDFFYAKTQLKLCVLKQNIKNPNGKWGRGSLTDWYPYRHTWIWEYHYWSDIPIPLYNIWEIAVASMQQNTIKPTTLLEANLPIAIMFKEIIDFQRFAAARNALYTPVQLLWAATMLILATGQYKDAYHTWLVQPAHKKTLTTSLSNSLVST